MTDRGDAPALAAIVAIAVAVVVGISVLVGGCAGRRPPRPPARQPAHPRPPSQREAIATVVRFARTYVNWDATDLSARLTTLAAQSVGQARSEMALAAAASRTDTTIERAGVSNEGTVEAVAPRARHPGEYVVVTRESTSASASAAYQGLAPAWHVTVAAVRLDAGQWVVSEWQPES